MPATTSPDYAILIAIILAAGLLAGTTNYLINATAENQEAGPRNYFKNILLSICAAITVPLFLQILPNSLLDADKFENKNYFIFAGLCILAGYYAKRFLEDLYSRVNKAEKKADAAQRRLNDLIEQKKELDGTDAFVTKKMPEMRTAAGVTDAEANSVIRSIRESGYFFRTAKGIAKASGLPEPRILPTLGLLEKEGQVEKQTNQEGTPVWQILPEK